jgi:outer membrane lipoprotein-sorting protein
MKKGLLIIVLIANLAAQTGYEIAKMIDGKIQPKDMISKTTMILTNKKGKTRISTMLSKSINGGEKQIIWFLAPADDKGVSFLKIEHDGKEDEMRMWLPAFKKVRRIASTKKGDSFMGSDLSYEDLTSRDLNENEYKRLDDETIEGHECYVLEITPKPEAKSSYSKHISWVIKNTLIGLKEESFDRRGELKKKKKFSFTEMKNYHVMKRIFVEDVQKNHTTEVTFSELSVDSGISQNLFHEKNLKRIPRK